MKKPLLILLLATLLSACSEQADINPETLADCIAIENPNDRDICKMKLQKKAQENIENSVGEREFNNIDF